MLSVQMGKALAARGEALSASGVVQRRERGVRELAEDMDAWEGGVISRLARDVTNGVLIARVGALTVRLSNSN